MDARALEPLALLSGAILSMTVLHPILQRTLGRTPPQVVAIYACVGGAAPLVIAAAMSIHGALIYDALVYTCIAYAYFHLFNMSETARRIRILLEVDERGTVEEADLRRAYSEAEVIDKRIRRMVETGSLERQGERYVVRGRLLYLAARVLYEWRRVLGYARVVR
jgi:hypothetical protein